MASNIVGIGEAIEARLDAGNGYGSSYNSVRRFVSITTQTGNIQVVQSSVDGDSFVILQDGVYTAQYQDNFNAACNMSLTIDSINGAPLSLSADSILAVQLATAANYMVAISGTAFMPAGTVVRAQTDGVPGGTNNYAMFKITKVG